MTGEEVSVVSTRGLTKHFKQVCALENFSCEIGRGEVVGLLGPNGSGKSTLVRLLLGFLKPTAGAAHILGTDCATRSVSVRRQVAYLPGDARLFRTMRGTDVLRFFGSIRGRNDMRAAEAIAQRLDLDLSRWVAFMSTGMRQKLALAAVLAFDAPLLILDEPTSNLDPTVRHEVLTLIKDARSQGRTVIFCSHVLSEIEEVCDRVLILRAGRQVCEQSLNEINSAHQVHAVWHGPRPAVPANVRDALAASETASIAEIANGLSLSVESASSLSAILHWLSQCSLASLDVHRVDLASVYQQYHSANL